MTLLPVNRTPLQDLLEESEWRKWQNSGRKRPVRPTKRQRRHERFYGTPSDVNAKDVRTLDYVCTVRPDVTERLIRTYEGRDAQEVCLFMTASAA